MKLTADRNGNVRHFSAKLGWKEQFESKEIEMLTAGAVPMLIPPMSIQGRKNNVIQFDISPYTTLEFYLSCILSREQFGELLLQCINMFRKMQQVYLSYKNLVYEHDKIYVLLADRSVHFIYLPLANSKREASIPEFFRSLVQKASHSTYEQTSFLELCLAWLNRPTDFVLDEFEKFVCSEAALGNTNQSLLQQYENKAAHQNTYRSGAMSQQRSLTAEKYYHPSPAVEQKLPLQTTQGNTVRLNATAGGTILLGSAPPAPSPPAVRFYIIRVQTNEKIEIAHSPFSVGTELGKVSYCVTDNSHVSRHHAEFTICDGACMITDKKSTNHSFVNDLALRTDEPYELRDGDSISLADERFTFHREG